MYHVSLCSTENDETPTASENPDHSAVRLNSSSRFIFKLLILFKFNLLFLTTVPVFICSLYSKCILYYFNVSLTGQ